MFQDEVLTSFMLCVCFFVFRASLSEKQRVVKDSFNQDVLDMKCLQLLRGLVHNEIVKLHDDWEWKTGDHDVNQ